MSRISTRVAELASWLIDSAGDLSSVIVDIPRNNRAVEQDDCGPGLAEHAGVHYFDALNADSQVCHQLVFGGPFVDAVDNSLEEVFGSRYVGIYWVLLALDIQARNLHDQFGSPFIGCTDHYDIGPRPQSQ